MRYFVEWWVNISTDEEDWQVVYYKPRIKQWNVVLWIGWDWTKEKNVDEFIHSLTQYMHNTTLNFYWHEVGIQEHLTKSSPFHQTIPSLSLIFHVPSIDRIFNHTFNHPYRGKGLLFSLKHIVFLVLWKINLLLWINEMVVAIWLRSKWENQFEFNTILHRREDFEGEFYTNQVSEQMQHFEENKSDNSHSYILQMQRTNHPLHFHS